MANTHGEKELRTDWDALTASDSTKAIGHEQSLKAEVSNLGQYDRIGINGN